MQYHIAAVKGLQKILSDIPFPADYREPACSERDDMVLHLVNINDPDRTQSNLIQKTKFCLGHRPHPHPSYLDVPQ